MEDIIISISDTTDAELIARVLAGARDDYAELIRRHHPRALGLCRSLPGDEALAEDAAQVVFLKAYERRRQARARSESLDAWSESEREGLRELPSVTDEDARRGRWGAEPPPPPPLGR